MSSKKNKPQKKSKSPKPSEIQASLAEAAFERVRARIEAIRSDEVIPARIDAQIAGAITHSIAVRDNETERRSQFQRLAAAKLYDMTILDELAELALAAWYARYRQLGRVAMATAARVPERVVIEGQEIRGRMLRVLEYWFGDDDVIGAELAAIRSGTGYQDLANDLDALADLYQAPGVKQTISADGKHFRASDVADARRNSQAIFKGLGLAEDDEAARWTDLTHRAWTLLLGSYEEHRECGSFLFRDAEDVSTTYPSLITAVRAPAVRRQGDAGAEQPAGVQPAQPAPVTTEPVPAPALEV